MTDKSLSILGDLTKPATTLIEKISDAIGGIFRPRQIIRVARAEAEAELIRAENQIQITDLQRRAVHRFLEEEEKRQLNIENITQEALPFLEEKAAPENMEKDWIANFFDKCRIVSDEDMQRLWSKVLAGEANTPGTFSKRTINLLADFDKRDAELFTRFCGFCCMLGRKVVPLVLNIQENIYSRHGITMDSLIHLESFGLIQSNPQSFKQFHLPEKITAFYYDVPIEITFTFKSDNELDLGQALLTQAGQELFPICGSTSVDGFLDFVRKWWAQKSAHKIVKGQHPTLDS